jgi:hypothetical protein
VSKMESKTPRDQTSAGAAWYGYPCKISTNGVSKLLFLAQTGCRLTGRSKVESTEESVVIRRLEPSVIADGTAKVDQFDLYAQRLGSCWRITLKPSSMADL